MKDEVFQLQNSPKNKSYKIHRFYNELFASIWPLYKQNNLTEALIRDLFQFDISKIPRYKQKTKLLEMMLENILKTRKPIKDYVKYLNHTRVTELEEIFNNKNRNERRTVLNVRIPTEKQKIIAELASNLNTVGDVIEIAIAYFIATCNDPIYQLIKYSFTTHISD